MNVHPRNKRQEKPSDQHSRNGGQCARIQGDAQHARRKPGKKAKSSKKLARAKNAKPARKADGGERSNKKAEVIALMKRAEGVTRGEIMEATS